jgi:hypothetical protein
MSEWDNVNPDTVYEPDLFRQASAWEMDAARFDMEGAELGDSAEVAHA